MIKAASPSTSLNQLGLGEITWLSLHFMVIQLRVFSNFSENTTPEACLSDGYSTIDPANSPNIAKSTKLYAQGIPRYLVVGLTNPFETYALYSQIGITSPRKVWGEHVKNI